MGWISGTLSVNVTKDGEGSEVTSMYNSLKYFNSHTQGVITLTMNDVFEIKESIIPDTTHLINRNAVLGSLSHYVALITIDRTLLATSPVRTVHSDNKVE